MLGILALGARLIAEIAYTVSDANCMSSPIRTLDDGTPVYMNRKGQYFVNGEKLVSKLAKGYRGDTYLIEVGERTGKVYVDKEIGLRKKWDKWQKDSNDFNEKNKRESIANRKLAYVKELTPYGEMPSMRYATCEMGTEKIICEVRRDTNGKYYKYYALAKDIENPALLLNMAYGNEQRVKITREEFEKLIIVRGEHAVRNYYDDEEYTPFMNISREETVILK